MAKGGLQVIMAAIPERMDIGDAPQRGIDLRLLPAHAAGEAVKQHFFPEQFLNDDALLSLFVGAVERRHMAGKGGMLCVISAISLSRAWLNSLAGSRRASSSASSGVQPAASECSSWVIASVGGLCFSSAATCVPSSR